MEHAGQKIPIDSLADDPQQLYAFEQLVITDKKEQQIVVRLFPEMTVAGLRKADSKISGIEIAIAHIRAHEENKAHYEKLVSEVWPKWQLNWTREEGPDPKHVHGQAITVFTADCWRVIAKIAFHYYLRNSKRGAKGGEPEFANLRRFIRHGGNREEFFNTPSKRFQLPYGDQPDGSSEDPPSWCHFLAADETTKNVFATVCLLMGPGFPARVYHLDLGVCPALPRVPDARFAHAYIYDFESSESKWAGRVLPLELAPIIAPKQ